MQVAEVTRIDEVVQIGGPAGWVADQVREARFDAGVALRALTAADNDIPVIGPHPHEAAIAAAREAALHLEEALAVEAPEEAIVEVRQALEALGDTIAMLERQQTGMPVRPGNPPERGFERAIGMLLDIETKLHGNHVPENGGIVPPWMR